VGDQIVLEISQIGKECHSGCAIFKLTGKCIMPKEGIFARVIKGGEIRSGDKIEITFEPEPANTRNPNNSLT
jgi:MOSC domain-containing protein YiiM